MAITKTVLTEGPSAAAAAVLVKAAAWQPRSMEYFIWEAGASRDKRNVQGCAAVISTADTTSDGGTIGWLCNRNDTAPGGWLYRKSDSRIGCVFGQGGALVVASR